MNTHDITARIPAQPIAERLRAAWGDWQLAQSRTWKDDAFAFLGVLQFVRYLPFAFRAVCVFSATVIPDSLARTLLLCFTALCFVPTIAVLSRRDSWLLCAFRLRDVRDLFAACARNFSALCGTACQRAAKLLSAVVFAIALACASLHWTMVGNDSLLFHLTFKTSHVGFIVCGVMVVQWVAMRQMDRMKGD